MSTAQATGNTAAERIQRLTTEGRISPEQVVDRCDSELYLTVKVMTVYKWASRGCRVDGQVVRLESVRLAGRVWTSWPALLRFLAAIQGSDCPECNQ